MTTTIQKHILTILLDSRNYSKNKEKKRIIEEVKILLHRDKIAS